MTDHIQATGKSPRLDKTETGFFGKPTEPTKQDVEPAPPAKPREANQRIGRCWLR